MVRGRFIGVVYFILSAISTVSLAETRGVQFLNQGMNTLSANLNQPFSQNLAILTNEPGATNLQWAAQGMPTWLTLNTANGMLTGTPPLSSVGTSPFFIVVSAPSVSDPGDRGQFQIIVQAPPVWDGPINLGTATVDQSYSFALAPHVTNPTGTGTIVFSSQGMPSWLSLNPTTGVITGTPAPANVGPISFTVVASISGLGSSSEPATGTVKSVPPTFSQNPVVLPPATVGQPFNFNLNTVATDPEGGTLTFTATGLPGWIILNSTTGQLTGTPPNTVSGAFSGITFTATSSVSGVGASASGQGTVNIVPPKWATNPVVLPPATVDQAYTFNLNTVATDPEGGTLTFGATGLPSWLSLNTSTGVLSGTPPTGAGGAFSGITFTATSSQSQGSASAAGQGSVKIAPPVWSENPVVLPAATVGKAYTFNLNNVATDPEGGTLSFSATGLPSWLSLSSSTGVLSGTPPDGVGGAFSGITFTATSSVSAGSASASGQGTVNIVPPAWSQNPVVLPPATVDQAYTFNLNTVASDPEGGTLSFTATGLPSWLSLSSSTGVLSGTPPPSASGSFSGITFTATSNVSHGSTNDAGQGSVKIAPPVWSQNPVVLPPATVGQAFTFNLNKDASDPEGGPLTFAATGLPSWLSLNTSTGVLSGTPPTSASGPFSGITFTATSTVSSGTASAAGQGTVSIVPPSFSQNPVVLPPATVGQPYTFNLNTIATDPEGGTLTFGATGLPGWLTLNTSTGVLSGTPPPSTGGPFSGITFTATSSVSGGTASAPGQGSVKIVPPAWSQNPVVLPPATVGQPFTFNLNTVATDPEGGTLTFGATGLPSWVTLNTSTGVLSGTPPETAATSFSGINFTATSSVSGGTGSASGQGTVNKPPVWSQNPVQLPPATASVPYTFNLNTVATDPEGGTITFGVTGLPAWLTLNPSTGVLSGTPALTDAGTFTGVTFTATAGGGTSSDPGQGSVQIVYPIWSTSIVNLGTATVGQPFSFDLKPYVTNPLGSGNMTYSAVGLPTWLTLNSSTGVLTGTPGAGDIGSVVIPSITASILGQGSSSVSAQGVVVPAAPHWTANPITLSDANDAAPYSVSVTQYAVNPEGTQMTYSLVSGTDASWATVSPTGVISGSPTKANDGPVTITVQFSTTISGTTYTPTTVFQFNVDHVKKPPVWAQNPVILPPATVGQPYTFNIGTQATDPEGGKITYSATGLPSWLTLSPSGVLSGTPTLANVGAFSGITFTATASGGSTSAAGQGTVGIVAPAWTANPITLPNATVGTAYAQDVTGDVSNPSQAPLTYSKVSGPPWASVSSTGQISGTPAAGDVGAVAVVVAFTTTVGGQTYTASTTFNFNVVQPLFPPVWSATSINLGTQYTGQAFTFDLKTVVTDPQGQPMTFSATGLPAWLAISSNGILSGTPPTSAVGNYSGIVFTATGVGGSSTATGYGVVKLTVVAPKWIANPITLANAAPGNPYTANLAQYVLNPSQIPVTFTILSLPFPPAWVAVGAASGTMTGTPQAADVGAVAVTVMLSAVVAGQTVQDTTLFQFNVITQGKPPVWSQNPITMSATVGQPFSNSLAGYASDPAGLTLTFTGVSGPAWLTVATNGGLSGTPGASDLGLDTFQVKVCNTLPLCATVTLNINVTNTNPTQTDTTQVDTPVDGAPAENLWVIGSYRTSTCLMEKVCQAIHVYYDDLNHAGIHHSGVMISADGKKGGNPVAKSGQSLLMTWNESDIVSDFQDRLSATYVSGFFAYEDNSPIWSMFGFYNQLPSLSSIYKNGYFMPQVPADTMIITEDDDAYQSFEKSTAEDGWDATKWAGDFTQVNEQAQKAFRISAMATHCGQADETRGGAPASGTATSSDAYDQLVQATQGTFYNEDQTEAYLETAFHDYASKVIFRAYVDAKHQIKLSKTPSDPSKIQVTIAGTAIDSSKWSYDPATNSVNLRWDLLGDHGLKPGDVISITYPTAGRLAASSSLRGA